MAEMPEADLDHLWTEYGKVFREFDDLTLARWMAQTLGQLEGRTWRASHPLLGSYRLAAKAASDRGMWLKRLATLPHAYTEAECCGAPLLPALTRDVLELGLICQHCLGTAIAFDDLPAKLKPQIQEWAAQYAPIHEVAHWDDRKRKSSGNYDRAYEQAAQAVEKLLAQAGKQLAVPLLDYYPAIVWEDHDECLEVRPEDVHLEPA
jgi:hypothetical protein